MSTPSPNDSNPHIVIIGGGIIGCTTAYYLTTSKSGPATSNRPIKVTLIEASAHGVAQGASGKAGGLVAKWAYPKELVAVSFREHERLAREHGGKEKWGWRYVGCGTWEGRAEIASESGEKGELGKGQKNLEKELGLPGGSKPKARGRLEKGLPEDLLWVKEELTDAYSPMGKDGHTAQVHPYQFTTSMFELAKSQGLVHVQGTATAVLKANGRVTGVSYKANGGSGEIKTINATHVLVAAGAWSPRIVEELPISPTRAHSVIFRPQPGVHIAPYVLFTEIALSSKPSHGRGGRRTATTTVSPEIYARPDGEVYACGPGDDEPLPETVDDVEVDAGACDSIIQHVTAISQELKDAAVQKRQACYLPTVETGGGPIVGEADRIAKGLYIATGHTCWGICNAPGTALALTELILDGKIRCGNLERLKPSVFL
ncbi:FAD dependent oxidoreductase [Ephemerocybe angulata]|uniref:FAD dependent oxidoreductase n=1 Tax=Ephemerocybe angulata TaxID=980116 RepID=A0A8H6M172_9AGAR|nr:FAD dependent oxidoreductase [Tulosesus angulatus]